ncbi:MAG: DUF362 domain-containing protein [Thermodesulfobacteriota bacterium]
MSLIPVSVVRYEKPFESLRQAVLMADGMAHLPSNARVLIKPNIVFWTRATDFPKYGVITTSRVVEDVVALLKEHGVSEITIAEGTIVRDPKDTETPKAAFDGLGYGVLGKRYGVKTVSFWDRPFRKIDFGDGLTLHVAADILDADFVVNLPVMKTHNQTMVSLGIKNLKGALDIASRKKCHRMDADNNLHHMVSRLADPMPPMLTVIDGIYTNERGPSFDGKMRRSDLLVASADVLAADMVGARLLGYMPKDVPHIAAAADRRGMPLDGSGIRILGESVDALARRHEFDFVYTEDQKEVLPLPFAQMGMKGLSYRKYDLSMCTYCSGVNGVVLSAIRYAWKGQPFDDVEILTGKSMKPTPGMKKTVLLGKCIYKANKNHPDIQEMIAVKGCPPQPEDIVAALHRAGIPVDPKLFENIDLLPGFFLSRYEGKPEFDPKLFQVAP